MVVAETPNLGLIVCDLNLPDVDGIEFVGALAESDIRCPLLFVSGGAMTVAKGAGPLAQAKELVVEGTLPKPLDHDDFIRIVAEAVNKRP